MGPLPNGVRILDIQSFPDMALPTDEKGSFTRLIRW
jgi:hypothetical protein